MFHCSMEYFLIWAALLVSLAPFSNLWYWIFYALSCEFERWAKDKIDTTRIHEEEKFTQVLWISVTAQWLHRYSSICDIIPGSISVTVLKREAFFANGSWRLCVFLVTFFPPNSSRWLCCSGIALADYWKLTCSWTPADLHIEQVWVI